ncbi:hypothetical protein CC78DRAFT_542369 [Lojkania enalia]|uniref:CFEM domain-containing protein n=1 Tax=Lojkania enalia TaxID=147567 RepID=A0A9P4KF42_9PLEO|nr:hypothetical protein CC78DRAFT_542369 [Didymosphaeria enalia]
MALHVMTRTKLSRDGAPEAVFVFIPVRRTVLIVCPTDAHQDVVRVAAQSLPECAQQCVQTTKTKCKATDFACACADKKYIPNLKKCYAKPCGEAALAEADNYLSALCAGTRLLVSPFSSFRIDNRTEFCLGTAVGVPIDSIGGTANDRMELRRAIGIPELLVDRQVHDSFGPDASFTDLEPPVTRISSSILSSVTATTSRVSTAPAGTGILTPSASNTRQSSTTISEASNTRRTSAATSGASNDGGGGGLSTGAKVGMGVGIPLGVIIVGSAIGVAFWMGKRSRKENAAAAAVDTDPAKQPHVGTLGMSELDQGAQFIGAEMETKHNVSEMPGIVPVQGQPQQYAWPHGQQGGYPMPQQSGYEVPQQAYGQPQYGVPQQPYGQAGNAAELPERREQ